MGTSEILLEGPKLAAVLPRLRESGARVVVDHFGLPDPARGVACEGFAQVLEGVRSGDTFVKLSAPYRFGETDPQRYVDALLDAGGPRQLVWASDWPFVSFEDEIRYAPCVRWIRTWIPDEAARRTVLVDTPAALFEFDREPRRHVLRQSGRSRCSPARPPGCSRPGNPRLVVATAILLTPLARAAGAGAQSSRRARLSRADRRALAPQGSGLLLSGAGG